MNKKNLKKHQAGFTLVELIIAMTLTTILTGMVAVAGVNYVRYSKTIEKNVEHQATADSFYLSIQSFIAQAEDLGTSVSYSDSNSDGKGKYLKYTNNGSEVTYYLNEHKSEGMTINQIGTVTGSSNTITLSLTYYDQTYIYYFTSVYGFI